MFLLSTPNSGSMRCALPPIGGGRTKYALNPSSEGKSARTASVTNPVLAALRRGVRKYGREFKVGVLSSSV